MAIEMNLHKINGLSNFFLSFNDDFFIGRMTSPEDFFQNGKPKLFSGKKRFTLEQLSERKSGNEYFHANNTFLPMNFHSTSSLTNARVATVACRDGSSLVMDAEL